MKFSNGATIAVLFFVVGTCSAGYEVTNEHHCGGQSIKSWKNGSTSNYGTVIGLDECKQICDANDECAGFVHRTADNICGFWKGVPLKPYVKNGLNCYRKLALTGAGYRMRALGQDCPLGAIIETKAECVTAGKQLKLSKGIALFPIDSNHKPAGCYYDSDDEYYFNKKIDATKTSPTTNEGGICKVPPICSFQNGNAASHHELLVSETTQSAEECAELVKKEQKRKANAINGMTWNPKNNACYAEYRASGEVFAGCNHCKFCVFPEYYYVCRYGLACSEVSRLGGPEIGKTLDDFALACAGNSDCTAFDSSGYLCKDGKMRSAGKQLCEMSFGQNQTTFKVLG